MASLQLHGFNKEHRPSIPKAGEGAAGWGDMVVPFWWSDADWASSSISSNVLLFCCVVVFAVAPLHCF